MWSLYAAYATATKRPRLRRLRVRVCRSRPAQSSLEQPSTDSGPHSRCAMVSAVGHNSRATGSTRDGDQRTYHLPAGLTANTARGHGNCHCHCHCSSQHGSRQVQSCASHLLWILLFINFTSVMYSSLSAPLFLSVHVSRPFGLIVASLPVNRNSSSGVSSAVPN